MHIKSAVSVLLFCAVIVGIFVLSTRLPTKLAKYQGRNEDASSDDYPLFLAPDTPDAFPINMVKRALIPKNASHRIFYATNISSSILNSYSVTCQVKILQSRPYWILQSLDVYGNPKTIGGDEYYITYTTNDDSIPMSSSSSSTNNSQPDNSSPTAVAFVQDYGNGSYALRFVTSPSLPRNVSLADVSSGRGTITIYLQYSCGVGHLAPPSKYNWSTGGAIKAKFVVHNVSAPSSIEPFVPPSITTQQLNGGGNVIDFGQYDKVIAYGDSIMGHFVAAAAGRRKNLVWPAGNVGAPLTMQTLFYPREMGFYHRTRRKGPNGTVVVPSMVDQIIQLVQDEARSSTSQDNHNRNRSSIALLLNSGVWDILADDGLNVTTIAQGPTFDDHRRACRRLIQTIREQFPPNTLDVYWRSPTAMHIHRVSDQIDWVHLERVTYMSNSRTYDLYRYQKSIMAEFDDVVFVDLYKATYLSAEHSCHHNDGRHYTQEFNRRMVDWFYPSSSSSSSSSNSSLV